MQSRAQRVITRENAKLRSRNAIRRRRLALLVNVSLERFLDVRLTNNENYLDRTIYSPHETSTTSSDACKTSHEYCPPQ